MTAKKSKKTAQARSASNPKKPRLRPKQEKFASEYIATGGNGAKAALAAGYSQTGARQEASRLLTNADILAEIEKRTHAFRERAQLSANEVIGVLIAQMRGSLTDVLDDQGAFDLELVRSRGMDYLLKKVRVTRTVSDKGAETINTTIEIHDSQAAAKQLCKILGLERAKVKNAREQAEIAVQQLRERTGCDRARAIELLAPLLPTVAALER